jgi:aldehyde:ferredoxin oxidoreductase
MAEKIRLLEVDLSREKVEVHDFTEESKRYLGGRGLGAKLLWDRVPQGADPLGPENILYLGTGPITGFFGSVVNISAKSPLTGLRGETNVNGHFGAEMVNAGYNVGLLVTGKAKRPVYLYIKNDSVEIRDASHLWGKLIPASQYALQTELRQELSDQNFALVTIGPAGENLLRNAGVCHDIYHYAARTGMGAVMGSKNLKTVAVRGTRPPKYANPAKLFQMVSDFFRGARFHQAEKRRWGNTESMPQRYYDTTEGIKNKQLGWDPICDLSNPVRLEQQYKVWNDSCSLCLTACWVPYMRRDEPLGPYVGEMRHDNAGGWNANVMLPGFDPQSYLSALIDSLGADSEDLSGVVAWALELYDRGLLTKEDLGGIDLTWGNLEAICKLVMKIVQREGIGDTLAEGLKGASQKLGEKTKPYAITNKGVAITSYEPRGSMMDAIGLVTNPVGELHGHGGGRAQIRNFRNDSLTNCGFLGQPLSKVFGDLDQWALTMLKAAHGWDMPRQEWDTLLQRLALLERCFSMREGYVPHRDDVLPERFFKETIYNKYDEPRILEKEEFFKQRLKWYQGMGLTEEGIPTRETLKQVGLDFALSVLDK